MSAMSDPLLIVLNKRERQTMVNNIQGLFDREGMSAGNNGFSLENGVF